MREKAASRVGKFTRIRAKVAPVLEKEVERKLKDPIKQMGGLCLKFVCPGFTGVPDRIILLPGGRLVFVETKQKGKKERPRQTYVHNLLRRLGFTVYSTVDSPVKVAAVVEDCRRLVYGHE